MINEGKLYKVLDWDSAPEKTKATAVAIGGYDWFKQSEFITGTLVEFLKSDGSSWLVKFGIGVEGTNKIKIFEYPIRGRIIVLNEARLYVINPEEEKAELLNPHLPFRHFISGTENRFVTHDDTDVYIIEPNGDIWISPSISIDGIKDVVIENNLIKGFSYTPVDSRQEWWAFTIDIDTKEITGGTYFADQKQMWKGKII